MIGFLVYMVVLICAAIGIYFFIKKKGLLSGEFKESTDYASTVQDFLPLEKIEDYFLCMKDKSKVIVLEVDSVSFLLMTEEEQEVVEMMFTNFLHSISYPIKFFIQTRIIDNTKRLQNLRLQNEAVVSKFPNLADHSKMYIEAMSQINYYLGQSKEKKKFIVIPYEFSKTDIELSNEEREEQMEKELFSRAEAIAAGLAPLGLTCTILDKPALVTLIYTCFNREGFSYVDNINESESLSVFTSGKKRSNDLFSDKTDKEIKKDIKSILNIYRMYPEHFSSLTDEEMSVLEKTLVNLGGKELNRDYDF